VVRRTFRGLKRNANLIFHEKRIYCEILEKCNMHKILVLSKTAIFLNKKCNYNFCFGGVVIYLTVLLERIKTYTPRLVSIDLFLAISKRIFINEKAKTKTVVSRSLAGGGNKA
jgi:hypothetical protein